MSDQNRKAGVRLPENSVRDGIRSTGKRLWGKLEKAHPVLAKWLYQIAFFVVFSMGVTILQYAVFTVMPGILGKKLAGTEFMWMKRHMHVFGVEFDWSLLGYNVLRDANGVFFVFKLIFPEK